MPEFREEDARQLSSLWERHLKGLGAANVLVWIVGLLGLGGVGSAVWQYVRLNSLDRLVTSAKAELDAMTTAIKADAGPMLVPPGTICAWSGAVPDKQSWRTYWRPCDGGTVEFSEDLWSVLRGLYGNPDAEKVLHIKLPDFRGHFLRGSGGQSFALGVSQESGTALPRKSFVTGGENDGHHQHAFTGFGMNTSKGDGGGVSFNGHFQFAGDNASRFLGHGGHSHTITGGDDETRPVNFAVHWVIRIQ